MIWMPANGRKGLALLKQRWKVRPERRDRLSLITYSLLFIEPDSYTCECEPFNVQIPNSKFSPSSLDSILHPPASIEPSPGIVPFTRQDGNVSCRSLLQLHRSPGKTKFDKSRLYAILHQIMNVVIHTTLQHNSPAISVPPFRQCPRGFPSGCASRISLRQEMRQDCTCWRSSRQFIVETRAERKEGRTSGKDPLAIGDLLCQTVFVLSIHRMS
ncbi:hypothetical protein SCHPADRAFT_339974 [Schizopora paradoxa]|uniref:Uncharacterized protein n=1 Tax=Schizopora paradoxa TaxID=27342 RepID=A0A0H2RWR7_9AGAM|nr:hypothetical protein SCHPADRAFT_339974 [Schizopora paradoxa]